jgi:cell wall-active antibiotic response 4TMS protein YvqF
MTDQREPGRRRGLDTGSLVWGLILVAIGAWFFAEQTLKLRLPDIPWGDLWPLVLIGLGVWIVFQAATRRS